MARTSRDPRATGGAAHPDAPSWATARRVAWAVLALAVALVALEVAQARVFAVVDERLLDLRLFYSHEEVVTLFAAYGSAGRSAYAIALVVDNVYPLVLLAAVVLASARAFGPRRWLWVAPVSFAVLDIVENTLFLVALRAYPDVPETLVAVAAPITAVKLASFPPTVVIGLAAVGVLAYRRFTTARRTGQASATT